MINRAEWLAAVNEAINAPLPETDAITSGELALELNVDRATALRRLNQMVEQGKAERTTKLKRNALGGVVKVAAYRLLKKTPVRKSK